MHYTLPRCLSGSDSRLGDHMYGLWEDDEQMPSCEACMDGEHNDCADLLFSDKYGLFACGCTNQMHQ